MARESEGWDEGAVGVEASMALSIYSDGNASATGEQSAEASRRSSCDSKMSDTRYPYLYPYPYPCQQL